MHASKTILKQPLAESDFQTRNRLEAIFAMALRHLHRGRLTVTFPSGNTGTWTGSEDAVDGKQFHAVIDIKSNRFFRRLLRSQSVGLAESYMAGEWDSPNLSELLELLTCNMDALEAQINRWSLVRLWNRLLHMLRANTKAGSKKNIAYHYDLGNDFYKQWLDPGMTYSSGLFDDGRLDLEAAQEKKYRRLAEMLDLRPGHRVLEIGCGWGGFAEYAAREYRCHITCLTLSREQLDFAKTRLESAGLAHLVEFRFEDYRDTAGAFDRIVSIEMFEAVGEEHWPAYFDQIKNRLKPGGLAGLQVITIDENRFEAYRSNPDFIQKYIFPGGLLPSPERMRQQIDRAALKLSDEYSFGHSYARTLVHWRTQFLRNWPSIAQLGYSIKFKRMWEFYLAYCEAGFRQETIDVRHFVIEN